MAPGLFATVGSRPYDRWWLHAACGPEKADLFFPEPGSLSRREWRRREEAAKQVCAGCPVREPCLGEALLTPEEYGVWGGLTAHERAQVRDVQQQRAGERRALPGAAWRASS